MNYIQMTIQQPDENDSAELWDFDEIYAFKTVFKEIASAMEQGEDQDSVVLFECAVTRLEPDAEPVCLLRNVYRSHDWEGLDFEDANQLDERCASLRSERGPESNLKLLDLIPIPSQADSSTSSQSEVNEQELDLSHLLETNADDAPLSATLTCLSAFLPKHSDYVKVRGELTTASPSEILINISAYDTAGRVVGQDDTSVTSLSRSRPTPFSELLKLSRKDLSRIKLYVTATD